MNTFYAAPYSLAQGQSIFAAVVATNIYGNSPQSTDGNGATVFKVPNPPTSLANNAAVTTDTVIQFTWTASSTGGTPVLFYTVFHDSGLGTSQYT